jgi:hypothetical protein
VLDATSLIQRHGGEDPAALKFFIDRGAFEEIIEIVPM